MIALDPRSLAAYRIAIALVVLFDLYFRAQDLSFFYTDAGVLPRSWILAAADPWDISIHLISGAWQIQAVLFVLAAAAAVALLLGYRTPQATVWTWILLVSLQRRNPLVDQAGDILLRVLLFWSVFLPLGRVWSLDSQKQMRDGDAAPLIPSVVCSVATACLIGQTICVYVFAALQKTGAQWTVDGTAGFYTLSIDQFATPLGHWLLQFPRMLRLLTFATILLERCVPFLLLAPLANGTFRLIACALFAAFHAGLALVLELGPFSYVGLALWTIFLPPEFWDFFRSRPVVIRRYAPVQDHGYVFRAVRGTLLACVFMHVLFWNLRTLDYQKWSPLYPNEYNYVLKLLGLDQNWGMFSPYPLTGDGWFRISARTASGKIVNLTPGSKPSDPITDARPARIDLMYPTERWRKYLMMLVKPESASWRPLLIRALALRWADAFPNDRLVRVDVDFFQEIMLPWCESTPVELLHLAHSDAPESGV